MSNLWNNVKAQHVIEAIGLYDKQEVKHKPALNTFLLYNNREYPAKHIRGLAYKIANNKEISTNDYTGGEETAIFLTRLGFSVRYKGEFYKLK